PSSSSSRTIYSDRFIPSRAGSNFALFDLSLPPSASTSSSSDAGREDGSGAYAALLRAVLFGLDQGVAPPATPDRSSAAVAGRSPSSSSPTSSSVAFSTPSRNIFRYKAEVPRYSLAEQFEDELPGFSHFHPRAPRKVPRSPYKVLDAPALQDDFYLNLVDWSSHNVLAVGLGNCVYLWNACSSKVTKLCDLGVDDSVCSVGWAQRGNHLAVGTNQGKVQVLLSALTLEARYTNRPLPGGTNHLTLYRVIWGLYRAVTLATLTGHTYRVLYLAISPDGQVTISLLTLAVILEQDHLEEVTSDDPKSC
ncbi:hypothetical protein B296_00037711, partial [Ensete ventricosum]